MFRTRLPFALAVPGLALVDPGAKQIYFEFSDYSTSYVFYENPD